MQRASAPRWTRPSLGTLALAAALLGACSSDAGETDEDPGSGQGGAAGRGGASAGGKGGAQAAGTSSGSSGQAGSAAQGGSAGSAGAGGPGGAQAAGQAGSEQGGSEQGGSDAAGGSEQGGSDAAGGSEQGGSDAAGGGEQGGSAQAGSGGSAGSGGGQGGQSGGTQAPTCQKAGGNRCGKTDAACAGLWSVDSSDCVSCCKVPTNPVIDTNYADPFVVRQGQTYYAFATGGTVRRRASNDLVTWAKATDALSNSSWKAANAGFWAPTVYKAKNGKWVLYYAAETNNPNNQQHCIGKAVADSIDGTFQDKNSKPFICGTGSWSIDPSVFQDSDGKDYLLWRQDTAQMSHGNAFIQRLDENGNLVGNSHELISRASKEPSWEFDSSGGVLENPAMMRHGNVYHLFYSGNRWETANYANGHAVCDTPIGPCKKTSTTSPWQGSKGKMLGPGGADFVKAADGTQFIYMHGWEAPDVGPDKGQRKLWFYRLMFDGQTPSIAPL